jgi:hypothetical protein
VSLGVITAPARGDLDLHVEQHGAHRRRRRHPQREAQRRHRRVLDTRRALDGEVQLDHAGDRFGIRGSIGSRSFALTPVERAWVDVPSGLWPDCRS